MYVCVCVYIYIYIIYIYIYIYISSQICPKVLLKENFRLHTLQNVTDAMELRKRVLINAPIKVTPNWMSASRNVHGYELADGGLVSTLTYVNVLACFGLYSDMFACIMCMCLFAF
jgi:hypothetical protein